MDLSIDDDDDDYFDEFIDAVERYDAVAFVVDDLAYIAAGRGSTYLSDVISFDPITQVWNEDYTPFEGSARGGAVAFVIDEQGYVTTGRSGTGRHDDIWVWRPDEEYEEFD